MRLVSPRQITEHQSSLWPETLRPRNLGRPVESLINVLSAHINHLQVTLPATLIVVAFLLKLFVDRLASVADVISAVLELPVDVAFLATTLVAGFAIARPSDAGLGVSLFTMYIAAAIVVVVLW